jgi:N6-adenosine-specific RNA methylase IME4
MHLSEKKRDDLIERAVAGEAVTAKHAAKQERREDRESALGAKQLALPNKAYGVILADPEWQYEAYSRVTGLDRAPENYYPTSPTAVIATRPVQNIAAKDCVLFLWATQAMLPDALHVMKAWGFTYKSQFIWRKLYPGKQTGIGHWNRSLHELLLIGTQGDIPAPAPGTQWASVVEAEVRGHSVKPDWQYELIEAYFPNLPKIELNARRARPGWSRWGAEAPPDPECLVSAESVSAAVGNGSPEAAPSPEIHACEADPLDLPDTLRVGHPQCWRSSGEPKSGAAQ